ncbi:helix-turn-helix domain-containing protein [Agromyces sp. NPDC055661]
MPAKPSRDRMYDPLRLSPSARHHEWLTIPEAAAIRAVSRQTIRRMIARGELEAERIGPRLIRVKRSSLDEAGTPFRAVVGH